MKIDEASSLIEAIEMFLVKVDPEGHRLRVVPESYFARLKNRDRNRRSRLKRERARAASAIMTLRIELADFRIGVASLRYEMAILKKERDEVLRENAGIRFMPRDEDGVIASLRHDNENLHRENTHLARRNRDLDSRLSTGARSA